MKDKVAVNISWSIPWLAGFLFTLEYCDLPLLLDGFWNTVWHIFVVNCTWPYILGVSLAGG